MKVSSLYFVFALTFLICLPSTVFSQIKQKKGRIIVKHMIPEDMSNPVQMMSKHAATYSMQSKQFACDPKGTDFKKDAYVNNSISLVDASNAPYVLRLKGPYFEVSSDSGFGNSKITSQVLFQDWKKRVDTLSVVKLIGADGYAEAIKSQYPIKYALGETARINGKSWRFKNINVSLSTNGRLDLTANQYNNRLEGFTGRLIVNIRDLHGNILAQVPLAPQGIDGTIRGSKNKNYNRSVNLDVNQYPELIIAAHRMDVVAERSGSNKNISYYADKMKTVSKDLAETGKNVGTLYAAINGM